MSVEHKMKQYVVLGVLVSLLATSSAPVYAIDHVNKKVLSLQSTSDAVDCFFFRLVGVDEADPIKPGDKWFAFPRSQYGAKDAYAMLLAAKLADAVVTVHTSGQMACGYAGVARIMMNY